MAIKYGDLKKRILLKIDEYEADVEGMTDDEDIINKMPYAVNEAIRFVFIGKSHNRTWSVEQGTPINALEPDLNDPHAQKLEGEHRTEAVVFEAENVCGYYFEVDDVAEILIEVETGEEWRVVRQIRQNDLMNTFTEDFPEYKAFKGRLNEEGTPVHARITFSGNYYYHYRNVCMHNVAYATDEKVPAYTGFRQHDIPKNLYQIVECYRVVDGDRKNVSYYTEDYKLYLPEVEGTIYLVSKFFPDPVTYETEDDYVIDIPVDTEWIVVAKAGAILQQEGEYEDLVADEEQYMQMLEGDRGRSGAPKIVRLH